MSREEFLTQVRNAAAAGRQYRVHVAETPANAGRVGAGDQPLARLVQELNQVGAFAHPVASLAEARSKVVQLLSQHHAKAALTWQHPVLDRLGLAAVLTELGVVHWTYDRLAPLGRTEQRQTMLAADVCISSVDYAIAETGTLAVCAGPGHERAGSLYAPVHIAVVERVQVLPDLFDLFDRLSGTEMPSNLTLITGPSKTGDIELTLTTGVHGPGRLEVVVVDA
jgi:L-lactate utilization protein LutC